MWFGALDERELFNPDEGRYAEIPREMVASGDWITPRLNGLKYFEKPALQYWITAAAYRLLEEHEWTARLWPAVSGLLTLLLVYSIARRLTGARSGVVAALLLASTFQFFLFSQVLTLDMGLTFFLTLAVSAFLASQDLRSTPSERGNWTLVMWAAMGLAVLSKGLVGVVLPALALLCYVLMSRDWKLAGRLRWGLGSVTFLVITLPWFAWVQLRNPEFFQFFFVREHFARYALDEHHRSGPWYYFLVILLVGALPWSFAYAKGFLGAWRAPPPAHLQVNPFRLLSLWIAVIAVFYSASASKLPGYILPLYPALAVLLACGIRRDDPLPHRRHLIGMIVGGVVLAGAAPFIAHLPKFAADPDWITPYVPWVVAGGLALTATSVLAWIVRRRDRSLSLPVLAFGTLFAFQLLVTGTSTESIEYRFSPEGLVELAAEKIGDFDPRVPFYSVDMYDQALPVIIGRTLTVVRYRGELAMGIAQEPGQAVASIDEFRERWHLHPQAYAIITVQQFGQEQAADTPMMVLAQNRRAVIVARSLPTDANRMPPRPDR